MASTRGWTKIWGCVGALAVVTAMACPLLIIGHLHDAFPTHIDFSGRGSGSGSAAPVFVFAGIALIDGIALGRLYVSDRNSRRFPPAFWFLVAVALWWLATGQAAFVTAVLGVTGIPWLTINAVCAGLFAAGAVLLLAGTLRKLISAK